jgi:hypothetical protein
VVKGLTYVPIPPQAGANLASLLTVELPGHVKKGQSFTVIVRRVTTFVEPPPVIIKSPPLNSPAVSPDPIGTKPPAKPGSGKDTARAPRSWRYITGAFQVNIPVKADADILPFDMNTLAIFKWRLQVMSPSNRWYPVLQRYIAYLSDRIDGLGGNAGSIAASPTGLPGTVEKPSEGGSEFTGKVCEVVYDCFGDFEGFVLSDCCRTHTFKARERGIGEIVLRACKERLLVTVSIGCGHEQRISKLVIQC